MIWFDYALFVKDHMTYFVCDSYWVSEWVETLAVKEQAARLNRLTPDELLTLKQSHREASLQMLGEEKAHLLLEG